MPGAAHDRSHGHRQFSDSAHSSAHNNAIRAFICESVQRNAARAAQDHALRTGALIQMAECHFEVPVRYRDFADFECRMSTPTFSGHRIDNGDVVPTQATFDPQVGAARESHSSELV